MYVEGPAGSWSQAAVAEEEVVKCEGPCFWGVEGLRAWERMCINFIQCQVGIRKRAGGILLVSLSCARRGEARRGRGEHRMQPSTGGSCSVLQCRFVLSAQPLAFRRKEHNQRQPEHLFRKGQSASWMFWDLGRSIGSWEAHLESVHPRPYLRVLTTSIHKVCLYLGHILNMPSTRPW